MIGFTPLLADPLLDNRLEVEIQGGAAIATRAIRTEIGSETQIPYGGPRGPAFMTLWEQKRTDVGPVGSLVARWFTFRFLSVTGRASYRILPKLITPPLQLGVPLHRYRLGGQEIEQPAFALTLGFEAHI